MMIAMILVLAATFSLFFRHLLWLSTTACNFPNSTWSLIMMLMMVMMMLMMVMMVMRMLVVMINSGVS